MLNQYRLNSLHAACKFRNAVMTEYWADLMNSKLLFKFTEKLSLQLRLGVESLDRFDNLYSGMELLPLGWSHNFIKSFFSFSNLNKRKTENKKNISRTLHHINSAIPLNGHHKIKREGWINQRK